MSTSYSILSLILVIVGSTFILAALLDFLYYRLPNKLFYIIFYLFPLYIVISFKFHLMSNYLVFVGAILIGFGLFSLSAIGGGDAKLLAAVALWVGWDHLVPFMLWMLLLGGFVSCLYVFFSHGISYVTAKMRAYIQNQSLLKKGVGFLVADLESIEGEIIVLQEKRMIPYGICIAIAGLVLLWKGIL